MKTAAQSMNHVAPPGRGDEPKEEPSLTPVEGICPSCGNSVRVPLPVEPLFQREEVCALVPIKLSTLRSLLHRYRHDPRLSKPRYIGPVRRGKRVFTSDDVRFLRSVFVRNRQ
jgi:hypothetical protein